MDTLARHFLITFNRKHRQERHLTQELLDRLRSYTWPGNIRELRNTTENYVITGESPRFVRELPLAAEIPLPPTDIPTANPVLPLREALAQAEKAQIQVVLNLCDGDVTRAAAQLGIHRSVLYKKITKYQLRHRTMYELD